LFRRGSRAALRRVRGLPGARLPPRPHYALPGHVKRDTAEKTLRARARPGSRAPRAVSEMFRRVSPTAVEASGPPREAVRVT